MSETEKKNTPKRPARLDIVDMPRDPARALGGLRQALCASFNYTRKYPEKLKLLRNTLVYVVKRIDAHREALETIAEAEKAKAEALAAEQKKAAEKASKAPESTKPKTKPETTKKVTD